MNGSVYLFCLTDRLEIEVLGEGFSKGKLPRVVWLNVSEFNFHRHQTLSIPTSQRVSCMQEEALSIFGKVATELLVYGGPGGRDHPPVRAGGLLL